MWKLGSRSAALQIWAFNSRQRFLYSYPTSEILDMTSPGGVKTSYLKDPLANLGLIHPSADEVEHLVLRAGYCVHLFTYKSPGTGT